MWEMLSSISFPQPSFTLPVYANLTKLFTYKFVGGGVFKAFYKYQQKLKARPLSSQADVGNRQVCSITLLSPFLNNLFDAECNQLTKRPCLSTSHHVLVKGWFGWLGLWVQAEASRGGYQSLALLHHSGLQLSGKGCHHR